MRPHRILHLSDLHFGCEDPPVVAALADAVNADPPDLVAISGDLTMRGRRSEFAAARAFIDALRAPVLAVPGNHDITYYRLLERFLDPYARWRRLVAPEVEPVFRDGVVGVVGLNTARRAGPYLDWSRGRVGEGRLARCEAKLAALPPELTRIVVAHHPFLPPRAAPGARVVGGAKAALAAFARQGVRLVLSGHLHVGDVTEAEGQGDVPAPVRIAGGEAPAAGAPRRGLTVVLSSTSTSRRLRGEPNAFNEIRTWPDEGRLAGRIEVLPRAWDGSRWAPAPEGVGAPAGAG